MTIVRSTATLAALLLSAASAFAQDAAAPEQGATPAEIAREAVEPPDEETPSADDDGPDEQSDEDGVDDGDAAEPSIEDSAILPSAGDHEESRAPSMELDCEASPEDCVEPLDGASTGPVLSEPEVGEPEDGENEGEGEPLTVEP